MAENFPRFCPRCGVTTDPRQRFCGRCGLDLIPRLSQQGSQASSQAGYQPSQPGFQFSAAGSVDAGPVSQPGYQQSWASSPPSHFPQPSPAQSGPPSFIPVQINKKAGMGRLGIVLVLLLVLAVLGGASFIGLHYLRLGGNATQSPATTTSINSTVTYAGLAITVVKVEQSQNFIDDPNSTNNGMLRVHVQAQNKTAVPVNLAYDTIAQLVAPGRKTLSPVFVRADIGVAPNATRTGLIDFVVPADAKVDQYILRLGAADEAQVDIPLVAGANLDKYAPKTTKLSGTFQYLGLDWTFVSATTQLSIDGRQASKGMRYISVTLKVNSTLSQTAIPGSAYTYMRAKAGNVTATPLNTTLPVSFDAGAMDKTGIVTFLVPQNTTTYTLILLAQPQGGFDQVTKDFQIS